MRTAMRAQAMARETGRRRKRERGKITAGPPAKIGIDEYMLATFLSHLPSPLTKHESAAPQAP